MGTPLCYLNARLGDTIRVTRSRNPNLKDGDTLFVHENAAGKAYVYIADEIRYLSSLRRTEGEIIVKALVQSANQRAYGDFASGDPVGSIMPLLQANIGQAAGPETAERNVREMLARHTVDDTGNPKDRIGITKPDYGCVPMSPIYELGRAMQNGADKYGAFNWREHDVRADVYINAARRHLDQWAAGDEVASDSKVHHLAHAMACMAILFDAQRTGNLIDNRHKDKALVEYIKERTELGREPN